MSAVVASRGVTGGRNDLKRGRRRLVRSFKHWVSNIRDFRALGLQDLGFSRVLRAVAVVGGRQLVVGGWRLGF